MNPEIFPAIKASSAVTNLIGSDPVRFYPWGEAPQNVKRPYVTYGVYNGLPENQVTGIPVIDNMGTQIDIYATSPTQCEDIFNALRDTLEPLGHMTGFESTRKDGPTAMYTSRQQYDFWVNR